MMGRKLISILILAFECASCVPLATEQHLSSGTITVQGAKGRLSPSQGTATVTKAVAEAPDPHAAKTLVALMESLSSEPLYKDNAVGLLVDGPDTYSAMLGAIGAARRYIHVEMYIVNDDDVGETFGDLLIEKAHQGVAVRLLYDSLGSWEAPGSFFDKLRNAGIDVVAFHPANPLTGGNPLKINNRDHRKMLIVDGEAAFTGGVNINSKYSSSSVGDSEPESQRGWRDTDIVVQGPAVEGFELLFLANWARAGGEPPNPPIERVVPKAHGTDLVRVLSAVGGDGKVSSIRTAYELAIELARERIWITQPYFTPDKEFLKTLEAAAKRGLDVRIIVPSKSDSKIVLSSSRRHYSGLLKAGVRIYELQGTMVHAKTAVIDGIWSTVGSSNLDYRSFLHNDEVNAVVVGEKFGTDLEQSFQTDLRQSREVTAKEWARRPLFDHVTEFFSNAVAYWL